MSKIESSGKVKLIDKNVGIDERKNNPSEVACR